MSNKLCEFSYLDVNKYHCLESTVDVYEAEHCLDHGVVLVEEEEDDGVREGRLLRHLTRLQDPLVQQGQHPSLQVRVRIHI